VTMAVGTSINGSKLWIRVGGGQTIQLGELAKVLVVIFLAGYLRDRRELLAIPTHRRLGVPLPPMRHLAPVIAFVAAALAVVAVLNDFGTALLFVGVFLAMLYLATGRIAYPAIGLGFFAAGSVLVYLAVPRIHDRITGWVNPFGHAQTEGYQLVQSLQALGDGGLFGRGLGRGFLLTADGRTLIPELRTDFIFSAVAHELGYIGAVGVLIVFLLLASRGISIAAQANDGFSKLLAGGLTAVLALQAFLIVAGIVRLVPLTGVTLPFMSYGGSSVVTNFGLIALLLVVSNRANAPARPAPEEREA
jgi:cell division protein FtsW (lipid II flippase)